LEPDCVFDSYFINQKRNGETVEALDRTIEGIDEIASKFVGCVVAIPDSIFLIHEWKIFLRPNNSCCLVCKFSFTGQRAFDFSTPCIIRDFSQREPWDNDSLMEVDDMTEDHSLGPNNSEEKTHSIKFRDTSKTIKYDNRKRGKMFTIGEYVHLNEMKSGNALNLQEEIGYNDDGHDSMVFDDAHSAATESSLHTTTDSLGNQTSVMTESRTMNADGVMRFHINAQNKISRIQCVRLPPANHPLANSADFLLRQAK
jgi:hypothetical protein